VNPNPTCYEEMAPVKGSPVIVIIPDSEDAKARILGQLQYALDNLDLSGVIEKVLVAKGEFSARSTLAFVTSLVGGDESVSDGGFTTGNGEALPVVNEDGCVHSGTPIVDAGTGNTGLSSTIAEGLAALVQVLTGAAAAISPSSDAEAVVPADGVAKAQVKSS
jgi:hypothetical protein